MTPVLKDKYGRTIDYLRISITDHCNLRCLYCVTDNISWVPHEEILRFEEITKIVNVFAREGIRKIRITGGEPLMYRDRVRNKDFFDVLDCIHATYGKANKDIKILMFDDGQI